jgi:16S rRNA (uracil1498-N3)-methyltransferase
METPYFHMPALAGMSRILTLPEEVSHHAVSVLRMQAGQRLVLVDGMGGKVEVRLLTPHRKRAEAEVVEASYSEDPRRAVTLAVSPLKNASRFEWMLEKAAEIGVREVVPLLCHRTEKKGLRMDRLQAVCTSAMLQSKQSWMTVVGEPVSFEEHVGRTGFNTRLIAHCLPGTRLPPPDASGYALPIDMLIGPEGDFTEGEVSLALASGFHPVGLGATRLRSETAALAAAVHLCIGP